VLFLIGGCVMSEWISVGDRLPNDGELVLIVTVSGDLTDYNFAKWSGDYWTRKAWPLGYAPTHWMPLPEPPKNKI